MEPITKSLILSMALPGEIISKNTGISIALVIGLIAATVWVTTAFNTTSNDIRNLQTQVEEMKRQQATIIDALQNQSIYAPSR